MDWGIFPASLTLRGWELLSNIKISDSTGSCHWEGRFGLGRMGKKKEKYREKICLGIAYGMMQRG